MNERIRELFKQAYGYFPSPIGEPETEKFAELIVCECAKFLDENSGYDDANNAWHPEPEDLLKHFGVEECMNEQMGPKDIRIGRLEKKIRKLIQQRDFHKERHEHYAHVISMQPYLESRWKNYEERKKEQERERVKCLEARCKEQEQLIRLLTKEQMDK